MADAHTIPDRKDVPDEYTWNLGKLFADESEWEKGIKQFGNLISDIEKFKGTLGQSAGHLRKCFDFMNELELLGERLGYYAQLRYSEDAGDGANQERFARFMSAASKAEAAGSYQTPEIQAIPDETMSMFLKSPELEPFLIPLKKILRFKPHILSEKEEKLIALQIEANQTASKAFAALTDVDMDFGEIETAEGKRPLTQSTYSMFMIHPERNIREKAYRQFYKVFDGHKNALSALYSGSVHLDKYKAQIRNHPSARAAALFPDDVPESVYDSLVEAVIQNLDALHDYYEVKRRALDLDVIKHYDVYVPLVKDIKVKHTYEEAVDVVVDSLTPLGDEYQNALKDGFLSGWVDRYENKGKRSGAFSAGSYSGDPHILMNYKEDVLRDVFTLAHEGGHSMHSWYSVRSNPFQHYQYTIFEAEVASTFNEQILADYMMKRAEDDKMVIYLLGKQTDDIAATIYRQTMFAEFESISHKMVESGVPLTVDSLRGEYRKLLEKYFGEKVELEAASDLEGLRIPHFYRAFYVYKYSTGLSAAISLAKKVMGGGDSERAAYLNFLMSGGSKFPLESLKLAGVDMSKPEPVRDALKTFRSHVSRLKELLSLN